MGCLADRTTGASVVGKVCTAIFVLLWVMEVLALALAHRGIDAVIPEITYLPDNMLIGFNDHLGIKELESGMNKVQAESEKVLAGCGTTSANFETFCTTILADSTTDTSTASYDGTTEKAAVTQAFADGLEKAQRVVNDKYFGKPSMATAAAGLNEVAEKLKEAPDGNEPCTKQNSVYCGMRKAAIETLGGVDGVNSGVKAMTENDYMTAFKEVVAPNLPLLHGVPYVFVLSLALFAVFWASASAGECCKSKIGVCMYVGHLIFVWVGNGLSIAVVVAYLGLGPMAENVALPNGFLATDGANLQEVKDHIKLTFPELWDLIFVGFGKAGTDIGQAFILFFGVGMVSFIYGILVCLIRPYKHKDEPKEDQA